jgi:hypothetical protein
MHRLPLFIMIIIKLLITYQPTYQPSLKLAIITQAMPAITFIFKQVDLSQLVIIIIIINLSELLFPVVPATGRLVAIEEVVAPPPATNEALQAGSPHSCDY